MQKSQRQVAYSQNDSYVQLYNGGVVHVPVIASSYVTTNNELFNACMNANGWSLKAVTQKIY